MIRLGLHDEPVPIGAVGRGYELTKKHGRTFDRWEAHYPGDVNPVGPLILIVNNVPPEQKSWGGRIWYRESLNLDQKKVWYRLNPTGTFESTRESLKATESEVDDDPFDR